MKVIRVATRVIVIGYYHLLFAVIFPIRNILVKLFNLLNVFHEVVLKFDVFGCFFI